MKRQALLLTSMLMMSGAVFAGGSDIGSSSVSPLKLATMTGGVTYAERNMPREMRQRINLAKTYIVATRMAEVINTKNGFVRGVKVALFKPQGPNEVMVKVQYYFNDGVNGNKTVLDTVIVRDHVDNQESAIDGGHQITIVKRSERNLE